VNTQINKHFLQSKLWFKAQQELGHKAFLRSGDGWDYLAIYETGSGKTGSRFSRLYLPYGPTFYNKNAFAAALADIDSLATEQKADYIRLEPYQAYHGPQPSYATFGLKQLVRPTQPDLTLQIDLNRPWEEIKADISKTNKYQYNKAVKNGLQFDFTYDPAKLTPFTEMMSQTASRTKAIFHPSGYYQKILNIMGPTKNAGIAYAVYNGQPIVGILFVDDHEAGVRYYMHAGSLNAARESGVNANAALVIELLQNAHKLGLKTFDFFGVAPKDAPNSHRWAGFSQFKRSFGGTDVAYVGTWEKPKKRLKYQLLQALRKVK
jgi:lipid II:glycine glycyltransferase (peptidoglycan interpeptide bridge formation enzyme)